MRKVILTMDESKKYETIKRLVDNDGNKQRAALELGCTIRHINRMIRGYKQNGKEFFVHGNKGRKPAHTLEDDIKQNVLDLYPEFNTLKHKKTNKKCWKILNFSAFFY